MNKTATTTTPAPASPDSRPRTAHTPGPWLLEDHTFNGPPGVGIRELTIRKDDKGTPEERRDDVSNVWTVATVNACMGSESEANAALIAAAPEMLEALRDTARSLETLRALAHLSGAGPSYEALLGAWAAINKATGKG